jgi:long-chain acyl-CoA synthetase
VAEAAVVGIPDTRLGEEVMAVVIRRPAMDLLESDLLESDLLEADLLEADLLEAELLAYCRERLAAYKCPRVFQFRAALPKNSLGKVLKDELTAG